jgi:hypothetical protein
VGLDAQVLGYKLGAGAGTTAGQAAQKLYSCSGSSGDVVQTTAASQPLLLVHEGANYLYSPRVTGNFCSTPSAAANSISGDIDIRVYYQSNTNGIVQTLLMKGDASSYNYAFDFDGNVPRLIFGGFTIVNATATIDPLTLQWYRVTRNSTNGDVIFYTSSDGITYTQLGSTVSTSAGNLPTNSLNLIIGQNTAFANAGSQGKIYRATISNSIGGAPVVDFNPSQYNAANSQTQWVSTSGETWTINTGTATTGYKGVLVDRTIMQGDGVNDNMASGTITSRQYFTNYSSAKIFSYGKEQPIFAAASAAHMMYNPSGGFSTAFNGQNLSSGNNSTALNCQTIDFNNTNSKIRINSGSDVIGASGTASSTNVKLFEYGGSVYGNGVLNTLIQRNSIDNDTIKTAMYNVIRSMNNNAF